MCPTTTPFISVTLIFYLFHLPRFVTLTEYSYTIGRNRISRRVISLRINVIHEGSFDPPSRLICLSYVRVYIHDHYRRNDSWNGWKMDESLSFSLSQRSRIGSLCVTECAFKPARFSSADVEISRAKSDLTFFALFTSAPSFLFFVLGTDSFHRLKHALTKKKRKRKAGVVS